MGSVIGFIIGYIVGGVTVFLIMANIMIDRMNLKDEEME